MAGSGKGKKKKSKGKSYKSKDKQHESSSFNTDLSQKQSGKGTEAYKDSSEKNPSRIDFGMKLDESVTYLERLSISSTQSSLERNIPSSISNPQPTYPYSMIEELSPNIFGLENLEFLKSLADCPDEVRFEDWLRTCSEDSKDNLMLEVFEQVDNIRAQANEKREWAKKTFIRIAKRFNTDMMELRDLRFEKNETDSILEQKKELEGCKLRINEKESCLKRAKCELEDATQSVQRLQAQNQENRAKLVAYQLSISEFEKKTLQAQKRERKHRKESNEIEKQIFELRSQIQEEKRNIEEMEQRLKNLNNVQEQAMLRLRQEKEAKEQAYTLLLEEKRLNRAEKENSKSRLASVQDELEMNYGCQMDYLEKLQQEVSQSNTFSSSSFAVALSTQSHTEAPRSRVRQCIICSNNDINILFLPCAHQVMCSNCNDEIFEALEDHCPFCKAQIDKRLKVLGPNA